LIEYVFAFLFIRVKATTQKVLEKKQFQNEKHDKEFDQYDQPELLTDGHASKPIVIEIENVTKRPANRTDHAICS
jgi:hypothetical protein